MGTILAKSLFTIGASILTEKVLMNLLVIIATWLARKTTNDLDDQMVAAIKQGLDHSNGVKQGNLYEKIKATAPVTK